MRNGHHHYDPSDPWEYCTGVVCDQADHYPLPVEPLYSLAVAAVLVPMAYSSLRKWLSRHREDFPARYRRIPGNRRQRLLTGNEIRRIRQTVIRSPAMAQRQFTRYVLHG